MRVLDPQRVIDEYARRWHTAMSEIVALTVQVRQLEDEKSSLQKRLDDIARDNGEE
jgi:predicted KAP-like P-loop ATPase